MCSKKSERSVHSYSHCSLHVTDMPMLMYRCYRYGTFHNLASTQSTKCHCISNPAR